MPNPKGLCRGDINPAESLKMTHSRTGGSNLSLTSGIQDYGAPLDFIVAVLGITSSSGNSFCFTYFCFLGQKVSGKRNTRVSLASEQAWCPTSCSQLGCAVGLGPGFQSCPFASGTTKLRRALMLCYVA